MSDQEELETMGDLIAGMFVERPCGCGAIVKTLPQNPTPMCDECAVKHAARERIVASTALFARTVPTAYSWAAMDAPELPPRVTPERAIPFVRGHIREPWMVFCGPSGAGKTSLAVALVRERVRVTGEEWVMLLAFRLGLARIQHRAGAGEPMLVDQALKAPFLLLDDLGQEAQTANNPIADIINERDAERRPTWITTGLSREDVGTRYNGGVARRMFERSRVVTLGHRDLKPAKSAQPPYDAKARQAGDT